MFQVSCDAGYNLFWLNWRGHWTASRHHAAVYPSRAAANVARRRAWKAGGDRTAIVPAPFGG